MSMTHTTAMDDSKIVIIGAGLSGLTMGYRLKKKGYNVSIYEARSRVGGRVHTAYVKNFLGSYSLAELGGYNITDGGAAPYFMNLAKELGLTVEEDRRRLFRGFYADGKIHNAKELLNVCNFSRHDLEQTLKALSHSAHSIADILDVLFARNPLLKRIFTYYMGTYEGLPPQDLAITHNIETLEYFLLGGMAPAHGDTWIDETLLLKSIKNGNSALPLALVHELQEEVFLDKVLQSVSHDEERIKLAFQDQTTVWCDKLILSLPCGVFEDIHWDERLLSKEKLEEIHKVQYGSNGKVMMPVADGVDAPYASINGDHVGAFHNSDHKLLTLYTDGVWGKYLEKELQNVYPFMCEMVEANYGKLPMALSYPVFVSDDIYKKYDGSIAKSWAEDPYAKGSYSAVGTKLGDYFLAQTTYKAVPVKTLFAPINDCLFFIGEHTSIIEEVGTMEAAVESAERLAQLF